MEGKTYVRKLERTSATPQQKDFPAGNCAGGRCLTFYWMSRLSFRRSAYRTDDEKLELVCIYLTEGVFN